MVAQIRNYSFLIALLFLTGCALQPSEPEIVVSEPELAESNVVIELVEVSQTMVLVRLTEHQIWQQTTTVQENVDTETTEKMEAFAGSFQVLGSYWNRRYCISEEIVPLRIQALENGHYMLQFHTSVRDLQRLQLNFRNERGQKFGELCVNCQMELRCN